MLIELPDVVVNFSERDSQGNKKFLYGGSCSNATLIHKAVFCRGARTALGCMRRGPTVFLTVSRNFSSWFEHGCADPDSFLSRNTPTWCSWRGVHYQGSPRLATYPKPTQVLCMAIEKFGFKHWVVLLPNPCASPECMKRSENESVRILNELMWS